MGFNNNQTGGNSGGQFYMARISRLHRAHDSRSGRRSSRKRRRLWHLFKLNGLRPGARSLGWHNLKVILSTDDGLRTDYDFYVDNVLAERVSNIGTAASIRSYDNIALGSGLSNGGVEAFVDNMSLDVTQAIPEPASLGLVAIACLGLVAGRRRS